MKSDIAVIILAAGRSIRMGTSKLSLPWGTSSVIGSVCSAFHTAGVGEIVTVLGGHYQQVDNALNELPFSAEIKKVVNNDPVGSDMLDSLKLGLHTLSDNADHVFVALGDNPQIEVNVIERLILAKDKGRIVIPSFEMRRGHPWLVERGLINELLNAPKGSTTRNWINANSEYIYYVNAPSTVLLDLDTPADYLNQKP